MLASIWWFFTLIMVSSYTANLAAFLTIEQKVEVFRDVTELAKQDAIKYGAKKGGSTANFFRVSHLVFEGVGFSYFELRPKSLFFLI